MGVRSPAASAGFVAELHCHTEYSPDGSITYAGLVGTARRRGIDIVCITDHDTIEGAQSFRRHARAHGSPITIVVGEERTLDDGSHLIGLFLQEPIASRGLVDAIAEVHAQRGLVLMPHPFRRRDGLLRAVAVPTAEQLRGIDAVEIFNAKVSFADNQRARGLLALNTGVFAGSDAHYESDVGKAICRLARRGDAEQSLRAMLRGVAPFSLHGVRQGPGSGERQYAPLYYRFRKYVRVPATLVPAARQLYRFYRNTIDGASPPALEQIHAHDGRTAAPDTDA